MVKKYTTSKRYMDGKVKRRSKKVNAELLAKLKALHKNGYSYGRLGEMFHLSRATAFNYINNVIEADR